LQGTVIGSAIIIAVLIARLLSNARQRA